MFLFCFRMKKISFWQQACTWAGQVIILFLTLKFFSFKNCYRHMQSLIEMLLLLVHLFLKSEHFLDHEITNQEKFCFYFQFKTFVKNFIYIFLNFCFVLILIFLIESKQVFYIERQNVGLVKYRNVHKTFFFYFFACLLLNFFFLS